MKLYNSVGRNPVCDSFRTHANILHLERETPKGTEQKYVDTGCGQIYLCEHCGKANSDIKAKKFISLSKALYERFPKLETSHIVFTLPQNHKWQKEETKKSYTEFFKAVKSTLTFFFPDCAFIMVLHNWSSQNPNEKHVHIHCIVFALNRNGKTQSAFIDEKTLKAIYRKEIGLSNSEPINVYCEYFKNDNFGKLAHVLRYDLRSPIEDYVKAFPDQPLSSKYIGRVAKYKCGMHHIRYAGWLSNRTKREQLEKFGIIQTENEEKWILIDKTELMYIDNDGNAHLRNGDIIPLNIIETFDKLDIGFYYKVVKININPP